MNKSQSTKEAKATSLKYEQFVLDSLNFDGYDYDELLTDTAKLQALMNTFKSEYCHEYNLKRYGSYQNVMSEWLMGLPSCVDIPFSNYDIIQLAKQMGTLSDSATADEEDKILSNYWNFMAHKIFVLFRKHKIEV